MPFFVYNGCCWCAGYYYGEFGRGCARKKGRNKTKMPHEIKTVARCTRYSYLMFICANSTITTRQYVLRIHSILQYACIYVLTTHLVLVQVGRIYTNPSNIKWGLPLLQYRGNPRSVLPICYYKSCKLKSNISKLFKLHKIFFVGKIQNYASSTIYNFSEREREQLFFSKDSRSL